VRSIWSNWTFICNVRIPMLRRFRDRFDAGADLASKLVRYRGDPAVLVLGLPRGGVPVAFEVARALGAPLDIFVVRKLGVPGHRELAMGAIASGGIRVLNKEVMDALHVPEADVDAVAAEEEKELDRQQRAYRGNVPFPDLAGRTAIVVDDGLATGSTMRAAVRAIRRLHAQRIVIAAPVAAADTIRSLAGEADEIVCVNAPDTFHAVSLWYQSFSQTSDEEVRRLLEAAGNVVAAR